MSVGNYDRTQALFDGRVQVEGCDITAVTLEPEEAFHRTFRYGEFDITETSMSSHMMTTARGDNQYVASGPLMAEGAMRRFGPMRSNRSPARRHGRSAHGG